MRNSMAARFLLAGVCTISLFICFLLPGPALSESGIHKKKEINIGGGQTVHPVDMHHIGFYCIIENTNTKCNEDVIITMDECNPENSRGKADFLGFSQAEQPGPPYVEPLVIPDFEDETERTIYFTVETGEDSDGCDLKSFDMKIYVCDTGPFGFFDCDKSDDDCEALTPLTFKKHIDAIDGSQPTGQGSISGWVTDSEGKGLHTGIHVRKVAGCLPGELDNTVIYDETWGTRKDEPDRGYYEARSIPFGSYEVTAFYEGIFDTQYVAVTFGNPHEDVDFIF